MDWICGLAAAKSHDVVLRATAKAKELLGKSWFVSGHISSMHWLDVPEFYKSLDELTITHLALGRLILTGVRSFRTGPSSTSRTARSRTSGENLFMVLLMMVLPTQE